MPADFDAERLKRAWARYCAKGAEVHPAFMSYLAPSASDADIAATEEALGCALAEDLRALLRLNNGSNEYQILPGWDLFDATRIVDEWRIWESLYQSQFKPEKQTCKPDSPAIRGDEWWRLRWIPYCGNGGGDHLCVDMDPADGGMKGQVISMWHDDPRRALIANSLTDFIEHIAGDFEQGHLTWDDELGGINDTRK